MDRQKKRKINELISIYRRETGFKLTLFEVIAMAYDAGRASAFEGESQERIDKHIRSIDEAIKQIMK